MAIMKQYFRYVFLAEMLKWLWEAKQSSSRVFGRFCAGPQPMIMGTLLLAALDRALLACSGHFKMATPVLLSKWYWSEWYLSGAACVSHGMGPFTSGCRHCLEQATPPRSYSYHYTATGTKGCGWWPCLRMSDKMRQEGCKKKQMIQDI